VMGQRLSASPAVARVRDGARILAHRIAGSATDPVYADMGEDFHRMLARSAPFTMTSIERMYAMHSSVRYVVEAGIPGDIVECGVWRGGSSMMAALTLRELKAERQLWLYDTFEGMPASTERDRRWDGVLAVEKAAAIQEADGPDAKWCYAPLDDVQRNLRSTGYPEEAIRYVVGKVEQTIPAQAPERIALLRLDTDWYESTRHELEQLWDRLSPGGILILDDYGHWQGAREATDEFFEKRGVRVLLQRVDYSARLAVKPAGS
jgi:O-methyltransferase